MATLGLAELLVLIVLFAAVLLITVFCLVLRAYRRTRRLQRRTHGGVPAQPLPK